MYIYIKKEILYSDVRLLFEIDFISFYADLGLSFSGNPTDLVWTMADLLAYKHLLIHPWV